MNYYFTGYLFIAFIILNYMDQRMNRKTNTALIALLGTILWV